MCRVLFPAGDREREREGEGGREREGGGVIQKV